MRSIKRGSISIMLILIIVMLVTITTAAVSVAISTLRDTTTYTMGERVLAIAESGAENAILRLLRDPSYTGEADLPIGAGTATIDVSGTTPIIVTSTGELGQYTRTVRVVLENGGGSYTITSWQEL